MAKPSTCKYGVYNWPHYSLHIMVIHKQIGQFLRSFLFLTKGTQKLILTANNVKMYAPAVAPIHMTSSKLYAQSIALG